MFHIINGIGVALIVLGSLSALVFIIGLGYYVDNPHLSQRERYFYLVLIPFSMVFCFLVGIPLWDYGSSNELRFKTCVEITKETDYCKEEYLVPRSHKER